MRPVSPLIRQCSHDFLREQPPERLRMLCGELRRLLLESVSANGGHLASNLGVVELTVALHRSFDIPRDKIIWDVGHQSYTHKILTGRAAEMETLRRQGGISGFPKTAESDCDAFIAGHASTSLAVAAGLKHALNLRGEEGEVVAVIGDGALTGGMAFEGLNNIGHSADKIIVVLNDNEMAISKSVGSLARYLSRIRMTPAYLHVKSGVTSAVKALPVAGEGVYRTISASKSLLKRYIYSGTIFDDFGFDYLGPIDGHDISALCEAFERAKHSTHPVLIHIETVKGKGYPFAEKDPDLYHGVGAFELSEGYKAGKKGDDFSAVFGRELCRLAEDESRLIAITAAMCSGTGLSGFAKRFAAEGRFIDVGIAEQYALTYAAALAAGGALPVVALYSTFLQRGYDQLIHDISIEPRHVVLAVDRAGVVGEDGETHQGLFDVAMLATVPHMRILSPATFAGLRTALRTALAADGPIVLRYPRGGELGADIVGESAAPFALSRFGRSTAARTLLVTYGRISALALKALSEQGVEVDLLQLVQVHPIPQGALEAAERYRTVLFAEEGTETGGAGERFGAALLLRGYQGAYRLRAVREPVPQASTAQALAALGLDAAGLAEFVKCEGERE